MTTWKQKEVQKIHFFFFNNFQCSNIKKIFKYKDNINIETKYKFFKYKEEEIDINKKLLLNCTIHFHLIIFRLSQFHLCLSQG